VIVLQLVGDQLTCSGYCNVIYVSESSDDILCIGGHSLTQFIIRLWFMVIVAPRADSDSSVIDSDGRYRNFALDFQWKMCNYT